MYLMKRIAYFIFTVCFLPMLFFSSISLAAAEKKSSEMNAYDPFADYSEFENTAEEQENINFFQTGRFLSLGVMGGAQFFTLNMAAIHYPGVFYGGYLNYFFDLQFAIQFALTTSSHHTFFNSEGEAFIGSTSLINLNVDFKYFFDKNLFHKNLEWFRPFIFIGVINANQTTHATATNQVGAREDTGFGANLGIGMEFHWMKKIHFGVQYIFHFVTLKYENVPLNITTGNADGNQISTNLRPYGDWMTVSALLGVNF